MLWTRNADHKVKFNWWEEESVERGHMYYKINFRDKEGVVYFKGTPYYIWTIQRIEE